MERYRLGAPLYDFISGERLVYRAGRVAAVSALRLRPGATVLDVGCGTGLSMPLLAAALGPGGHVIGVDRSRQMLHQARRRARHLPCRVTLAHLDATAIDNPVWCLVDESPPDAVLFAYSLSVMRPWPSAWEATMRHTPAGSRVAVLDLDLPSGVGRVARIAAAAAARLGGSDLAAHPWEAMPRRVRLDETLTLRGGHLRVTAGTRLPCGQPSQQ